MLELMPVKDVWSISLIVSMQVDQSESPHASFSFICLVYAVLQEVVHARSLVVLLAQFQSDDFHVFLHGSTVRRGLRG